jgi:glycosyltransferase involved in cell wall biosynthesis
MSGSDGRIPILYIAPWMELGGTSKGTLDWFRWLDRDRFRPSLVTTQPSDNPWLADVAPYVDEVWPLPELMKGMDMPGFILDFIHTRGIRAVHIMDSRLGYDLLPDIRSLPHTPATVVQLHVEEHHRAGYVRYVTTRYGNLVDAFSVTSRQLADAIVDDYSVPSGKCRVIYTGVDTEREFSPDLVVPRPGQPQGPFNILFPARLVEQKDPLLMVDVARHLKAGPADFRIHVLGDGDLEDDVRAALRAGGLEDLVLLHGPQHGIADWLAAADATLLTSLFEGVPYVGFESMSMGRPLVGPALPGLRELVGDGEGVLIDPRDDAPAYAAALAALATDPELYRAMAERSRRAAVARLSVKRMARAHEELYVELLGEEPPSAPRPAVRPQLRFRRRPSTLQPRVSVIVACFDDGHFLTDCLDSIHAQTYPDVETILVDDGSRERETVQLLDRLALDERLTVVRQPENRGPGVARNAGIELATGRYVLPVDADNELVPDAIENLVGQLQNAGEEVGFVYPNLQFFGNRDDYYEAPAFNLHTLLDSNFCDTCSLLDREIFDAGIRYSPEKRMAHEDWQLALDLASMGVRGEAALTKTLRFRKRGWSRGDTAWYGIDGAYRTGPHPPNLSETAEGPSSLAAIKARWSPALSIVLTAPVSSEERVLLTGLLKRQSCVDAEVLLVAEEEWSDDGEGPLLRRLPPGLCPTGADTVAWAFEEVRARFILVTDADPSTLLADAALIEKVLRTFESNPALQAIAFTDAGSQGRFAHRLLRRADDIELDPHTVAFRQFDDDDSRALAATADVVRELVKELESVGPLQWRHLEAGARPAPSREPAVTVVEAAARIPEDEGGRSERTLRLMAPPRLPRLTNRPERLRSASAWVPAETQVLCRHHDPATGKRFVTTNPNPPPGWQLEYYLCVTWSFPLAGTARLTATSAAEGSGQAFEARDDKGGDRSLANPGLLGHVDRMAFPMLEPLELVRVVSTGEHTLLSGEDDPLQGHVEKLGLLGWVDSVPIKPKSPPSERLPFGLVGLLRAMDPSARRHRYAVGEIPGGHHVSELGALLRDPGPSTVPVSISADGRLSTAQYAPSVEPPAVQAVARWVAAPAAWRDVQIPVAARTRAVARRTAIGAGRIVRRRHGLAGQQHVGHLHRRPGRGRRPLYSSLHPVTADQLLSTGEYEGNDLGYVKTELIGYLVSGAPETGTLGPVRTNPSWASRFGLIARTD